MESGGGHSNDDVATMAGATSASVNSARLGDGDSQLQFTDQLVSTDDRRHSSATQLSDKSILATTPTLIPCTMTPHSAKYYLRAGNDDFARDRFSVAPEVMSVHPSASLRYGTTMQWANCVQPSSAPLFHGMRITPTLTHLEEQYWRTTLILDAFVSYFDKVDFGDNSARLSACYYHAATYWTSYILAEGASGRLRMAVYGQRTHRPALILAGYYKLSKSNFSGDTHEVCVDTGTLNSATSIPFDKRFIGVYGAVTTPFPSVIAYQLSPILPAGVVNPAMTTLKSPEFCRAVRMALIADVTWLKSLPVADHYNEVMDARDDNREAASYVQSCIALLRSSLDYHLEESAALAADDTESFEVEVQLRVLLNEQQRILSFLSAYSVRLQRLHYQICVMRKEFRRRRRNAELTKLLAIRLAQSSYDDASHMAAFRQQFLRAEKRLHCIAIEHGLEFVCSHIGYWMDDRALNHADVWEDNDILLSADRTLLRIAAEHIDAHNAARSTCSSTDSPAGDKPTAAGGRDNSANYPVAHYAIDHAFAVAAHFQQTLTMTALTTVPSSSLLPFPSRLYDCCPLRILIVSDYLGPGPSSVRIGCRVILPYRMMTNRTGRVQPGFRCANRNEHADLPNLLTRLLRRIYHRYLQIGLAHFNRPASIQGSVRTIIARRWTESQFACSPEWRDSMIASPSYTAPRAADQMPAHHTVQLSSFVPISASIRAGLCDFIWRAGYYRHFAAVVRRLVVVMKCASEASRWCTYATLPYAAYCAAFLCCFPDLSVSNTHEIAIGKKEIVHYCIIMSQYDLSEPSS